MDRDIKLKFPGFCSDNVNTYDLCLSDDLDSLLSSTYLRELKGYHINYFYDFNNMYRINESDNNAIAIDADFTKGMCWGNHVTILNNKDHHNKHCANLNVINRISRENYYSKYCGSTLLQILSYYDVDISNLSEEGKMILLCIDSSFLPFYNPNFKDTGTHYMKDILEFPELVELTKKHTQSDFIELNNKYNLKGKITIEDGYLKTDINLAGLSKVFSMPIFLPEDKFELFAEFTNRSVAINNYNYNLIKGEDVFSFVLTGRDYIKFSKKKGE